jgi:ZIP family zinc transporter
MGYLEWLAAVLEDLASGDKLVASALAGFFVAFTTTAGAAAVFLTRRESEPRMDVELSFAAGLMLVSSFTSLILPGIQASGFLPVAVGIALGVAVIHALDRLVPHEHAFKGYEGPPELKNAFRKTWLLALAVIIHNLPEGLTVGVTTVYSIPLGVATAVAIGLQDVPEGLAVALPVSKVRGRFTGFLVGALSGLSETAMAVVAALFFDLFSWLLPVGMGFAGGAMLYVTLKELVPEIYREGVSELKVTLGLLAGFYVMLLLDSML